jgi:hypothetical protein
MTIIESVRRARAAGVPLIAINTADQPALVDRLRASLNGAGAVVGWDVVRGFAALNPAGSEALAEVIGSDNPLEFCNPVAALVAADKLPVRTDAHRGACLIMQSINRHLGDAQPIQAVLNLRDSFKATGRTLVMLGADFSLPPELAQDTLILDEELPSQEAIAAILGELYEGSGVDATPDKIARYAEALRGLAAFPVEQSAALAVNPATKAVEPDELWQRKRRAVAQTKGLSMEKPTRSFKDVGGLEAWKRYATRLFNGPKRPKLIVNVEEIEKQLAGASDDAYVGDSGTGRDQLQVLLTEMEDQGYLGALFVGVQGSGKSEMAKATAAEFGVPLVRLDLGGMKGSLQGESQAAIRAAMRTILAIAGPGGACFIGTCNALNSLPPALQRRFTLGVWFYDLPDREERKTIGDLHITNAGLEGDLYWFASKEGWSGADIRNACQTAYALSCPLDEAASYIIPAAQQSGEALDKLRRMAAGRFLSAAYGGVYRLPDGSALIQEAARPSVRKIGQIDVLEATEPLGPPAPTEDEKKHSGN